MFGLVIANRLLDKGSHFLSIEEIIIIRAKIFDEKVDFRNEAAYRISSWVGRIQGFWNPFPAFFL